MSRYGRSSRSKTNARLRHDALEKSHIFPSESGVVRSNENPPRSPAASATVTIRGGEYTSATSFTQFSFFLTTFMSFFTLSSDSDAMALRSSLAHDPIGPSPMFASSSTTSSSRSNSCRSSSLPSVVLFVPREPDASELCAGSTRMDEELADASPPRDRFCGDTAASSA